MGKCVRPRGHQFLSMHLAPLTHQAQGAAWESARQNLERRDVNGRTMFPVSGVEMRRRVLGPVQRDDYAVEFAQPGHRGSLSVSAGAQGDTKAHCDGGLRWSSIQASISCGSKRTR